MKFNTLIYLLFLILGQTVLADKVSTFTKDMDKHEGFLTFYWDNNSGKIYGQIDQLDKDLLYISSLASGVGSNDIGLDRGQLGTEKVVQFKRTGPKIFLHQPNLDYRAISENPIEVRAVDEAFATSIIWGFKVVAEENNSVLIDMTDFLLRDSHGIKQRLSRTNQGSYKADKSRSAIYLPRTKNFPENTEFEATLTMTGSNPGTHLRSVTPDNEIVTVRTHHSFIKLPDDNYKPRVFDPRTGQFYISYQDYAAPLGTSMTKRLIVRHRLQKTDPEKAVSTVVEPIVYYLDPGVPEPVRSALKEGANWWIDAFEAAGFKNAFRVELLPDDADPMDVRYNTIQWVHRSTRGWSYGSSIIDPRTGEILKGHVTLGSLRVRQDMLIAQGLTSPFTNGDENDQRIQEMALARLKQLSAHEVGHTIGLAHNFSASPENRASVMDYPHPLVKLDEDGNINLNDAYDKGIGLWDKLSVAYAYAEFSEGNEEQGLEEIVKRIQSSGIEFITDQDSRASSMAHPKGSLWDNGVDPVEELKRVLKIRKSALNRFGKETIKNGTPWSELEKLFVPIFLFHRYQSEAAAKLIGGIDYQYALRGDDLPNQVKEVSSENQREAFETLLSIISADELQIPQSVIDKLLPPAFGYPRNRESFNTRSRPAFDVFSAVETAASQTLELLLDPARSVRLVQQKALNQENLGLFEIQNSIINKSWKVKHKDHYLAEVQRSINWEVLKQFFELAKSSEVSPQVRAITVKTLMDLKSWLSKSRRVNEEDKAMYLQAAKDIQNFMETSELQVIPETKPLPPGSPIG